MKTIYKYAAAIAIGASALISASAQNTYSGYFLDNYTYRYQLNPAFGSDKNFVSIPGIGNINASLVGNLNLGDVLYNVDGQTVLFTNPDVSTQQVLANINDDNHLESNIKLNILSAGFKAFGGFNTISINARTNIGFNIPRTLFSLAKEGLTNKSYDISNMGAHADAYAEIALGHSREIIKGLRIGANIKVLLGIGNVDAYFNEANIDLGHNDWIATTNADIYASVKGLSYKTSRNEHTGHEYVSSAKIDNFSAPTGYGFAADLGVEYKYRDFSFSAAVLDLGVISWDNTMHASTNGTKTVHTDAFTFNVDDNADNSLDKEFDLLVDDLSKLYELEDNGNIGKRSRSLAPTMNASVEYALPMYRKLSFGLLNTTHFDNEYSWTQFTLGANWEPSKCFSAGVNGSYGTFGWSFGWIANVRVPGFNLFLGMDHTPFKLAKQGVPLNSNVAFNFGLNVTF